MYYEFFGLRDAPFRFLPSNTLFLSPAHLEGYAALEWGFSEPSGLTLLVGEVGTGKTMLIHALVTRVKDDRVRIAQISNPTMSFQEILDSIVQQLGIHPAGKSKLAQLQALKTFVSDPASSNRVILIFDEAQGLSDKTLEEVRLLSNSRPPERHALQIILVGQPELTERLGDPKLRGLNQRIGARALLRPLRGQEVHDYIEYLLRAQGGQREIFSSDALDRVARLSGGLPRKINNLCHNALFLAYAERSPKVEARHVRAAGAEFENLHAASSYQWSAAPRAAIDWMSGMGWPLKVGCLSGLIVVAVALLFEFGTAHPRARPASVPVEEAQEAEELSKPPLASAENPNLEVRSAASSATPQAPVQNSNHSAAAPPQAPAVQTRASVAPKPAPMGGSLIAGSTSAQPQKPEMPPFTSSDLSPSAATPKASYSTPAVSTRKLTYAQERRLRYDTRRATSSFNDGRYANAIWHARRALVLDPGNTAMRDLIAQAQADRIKGTQTASEQDSSVASAQTGDDRAAIAAEPLARSGLPISSVVRSEISEGDAYMRAGKYDIALRKFSAAAVLDPGNEEVTQRIKRAQRARQVMGGSP